jgi:hypothetical protein
VPQPTAPPRAPEYWLNQTKKEHKEIAEIRLYFAVMVGLESGHLYFSRPKEFHSKRGLRKIGIEYREVACRVGSKQISGFSNCSL